MTPAFNPDPKLQAEAMKEQFTDHTIPTESIITGMVTLRQVKLATGRACALIAAEMCKAAEAAHTSEYPTMWQQTRQQYWSAAIEELKKL